MPRSIIKITVFLALVYISYVSGDKSMDVPDTPRSHEYGSDAGASGTVIRSTSCVSSEYIVTCTPARYCELPFVHFPCLRVFGSGDPRLSFSLFCFV